MTFMFVTSVVNVKLKKNNFRLILKLFLIYILKQCINFPPTALTKFFGYLEDEVTLHSCLLVNRLWCEISVRIIVWKDVCDYSTWKFRTLIACLPNESKEILYENGIIISTPISKSPTFNYASFCKILSINKVHYMIEKLLNNQQSISPQNLKNNTHILVREIHKMLMNQISSLKRLDFLQYKNITFTFYPEAKDCLKNLSELHCNSSNSPEFFYHLLLNSKVYKNLNYHLIMMIVLKILKNYNMLFSHNYKF